MGNYTVLFISILYGILFVFFLWNFYRLTVSDKCGILFIVCHFMYVVIYSLVPMLVHYHIYEEGQDGVHYSSLDYSFNGCVNIFTSFIFAIIGYVGFVNGYFRNSKRCLYKSSQSYSYYSWFICAVIALSIGCICFYFWTKVYGGPIGVLVYASAIRSGYDIGIDNPYTVFKRFVPLVQFSNIVSFGLLLNKRNLFVFILFIVSLLCSILYLFANAGRAPLVMHFASLVFLYFTIKNNSIIHLSKNTILKFIVACSLALFVAHNYEKIYSDIFNSEKALEEDYNFDLLSSLREEFSFTVRSNQAIFEYLEDNPTTFRMPVEIASGFLGIMPSSFRPKSIEKLEVINTKNWDRSRTNDEYFGGRPPDLIVTGIYTLNVFGVLFLPFILGYILRRIENVRNTISNEFDNNIFYALCLYPVMRIISYTNFDGLMLNFFYIIIGYLILKFVSIILYKR